MRDAVIESIANCKHTVANGRTWPEGLKTPQIQKYTCLPAYLHVCVCCVTYACVYTRVCNNCTYMCLHHVTIFWQPGSAVEVNQAVVVLLIV